MPFEPRDLPTAIWFGDECIAGPFCIHCGYPLSLHGPELQCSRWAHPLFPKPACDCHRLVRGVRVLMVPNTNTTRRRRDGSPIRMRQEIAAVEIVHV